MNPIQSEGEYAEALKEIECLIDQDPVRGSEAGDRLGLLMQVVGDYEARRFPRRAPDPVEAIRFRMEQMGLSPRDLVPYIGSRAKVSEVLSGKRKLSLPMIRALQEGLGIPAKSLLAEPVQPEAEEPGMSYEHQLA